MTEQVIDLNGETIAYREFGPGEPMVLVHGSISDSRSWAPLGPLLAARFRVINYSRRYVYPNRPIHDGGDDSLSAHAEDLLALIEKLRLGLVHVVGNSSGAFIALLAAQKRPDLVRTLTLEDPPVVSMFLQALPPKLGEVIGLLLSSPAALVDFIRFGAGTIAPTTNGFREGRDDTGHDLFARGALGDVAYANVSL